MTVPTSVLVDGLGYLEAPRWHDGELWCSDFVSRSVLSIDLSGVVRKRAHVQGQPSGIGFAPDGTCLVVSTYARNLLRLPAGEGRPSLVADTARVWPGFLNDMCADSRGRAYISAFVDERPGEPEGEQALRKGTVPVLAVEPDGTVRIAAPDLAVPNGLALTADGCTLVVAESVGKRLTAFDVAEDGTLSGRRGLGDLDGRVPDGICIDVAGGVWVACPFAGEFLRMEPDGAITDVVATPGRWAVACALGGPELTTLFCLTARTTLPEFHQGRSEAAVEVIEVEVPGW